MREASNEFENFNKDLGTKTWKQKIYKIAKNKKRKSRDLDEVGCIKDEEGKVLVSYGEINDIWKAYFYKLFIDGGGGSTHELEGLTTREGEHNLSFYHKI
ncbi:hypothetical protein K1719_010285 [Acacia pycnantha]|nr:hypothetical protein K1719_010285 [Acacia pycnantha]